MRLSPLLLFPALLMLTGCRNQASEQAAAPFRHYGCVSCHTIPGIADAQANVGPPLSKFGRRTYISGTLPNNTSNLAFWLQHPQAIHPGTAMPEMNVTPADAKIMAHYLENLR